MRRHIATHKSLLISLGWLTTIFLVGAMFTIALLPEDQLREYPSLIDHVVKDGGHMLGFLVFTFFLRLSVMLSFGKKSHVELLSVGAGPLLAALTEVLQRYSPGREPNPWDFSLDVIGTVIGVVLAQKACRLLSLRPGENDAT